MKEKGGRKGEKHTGEKYGNFLPIPFHKLLLNLYYLLGGTV